MAMNTYTTSSCGGNLQNSLYKGLINKEIGNATSNSIAASNQSIFIPKKVSALLLSLICVLTLAACGGDSPPEVNLPTSIGVSNLRVIPDDTSATLIWDNPAADITRINISYKLSTAANFGTPILITDDARIAANAKDVMEMISSLVEGANYTFNVLLELGGADEDKTVNRELSMTRLIGPNLDGDEYADADPDELDEDGDGVDDEQDAFPRNDALTAFAVSGLTADAGDGEVTLSWTNPDANISSISISYQRDDSVGPLMMNSSAQITPNAANVEETIDGLTNGQSYTFNVNLILTGDDADKEVEAQSVTATPILFTISVLNLRIIPDTTNATLIWDNPDASITQINISYKLSTDADFGTHITITDDAKIATNATDVMEMITSLTSNTDYTFRVLLELGGADENVTTSAVQMTRLIGPNLDGDEYADADSREFDKDGDNVNDVQDAFPDDRTLSAFTVTDLIARPGNQEATLIWTNPVANISSINISYHNTSAPNTLQYFPLITNRSKTAMNAMDVQETIANLTNGVSYTFNVTLTLTGDDADKEVETQSVTATPILFTISVLNLRIIPDTNNATLRWDNPDADIANINISYKLSTDADFGTPITITDDAKIATNATDVMEMITSLTSNTNYTFRVTLELGGTDENVTTSAVQMTRLIGPNLDGDEYADDDPLEKDEDGDGTNDEQDAFPRNDALSAFTVSGLTARPGNQEATLIWTNPVANISSISISYKRTGTNDSPPPVISTQTTPGAQNVEETIPGLTNGQSYTFKVTLILDEDDEGKRVSEESTTATLNLFIVRGLTAVAGDSNVTLSWTNPDTVNIASINISYHNRSAPDDLQYVPLITDATNTSMNAEVRQSITGINNEGYYTFIVALTLDGDDTGREGTAPSIEVAIGPDYDGDGIVNFLDTDGNGDGRPNRDSDGDGTFNYLDDDDDGDSFLDEDDVDDDGDGLIEIATAEQLNQTRHNLLGSNFTLSPASIGNEDGCGNGTIAGEDVIACNGYELSSDISLADYANWEPIGGCITYNDATLLCDDASAAFNAIFDGNGWTISNLTITNPAGDYANGAGLFGVIAPTSILRNVHIRSANISGGNNVGLLVGYARGIDASKTIISNSSAAGEVTASGDNVGGLVGNGEKSTITSSYAEVENVRGAGMQVGGLVGDGGSAVITSSYASGGNISGSFDVGGLVGDGAAAYIIYSYAEVDSVIGTEDAIGGLVGEGTNADIISSYAVTGSVRGIDEIGGLVGDGRLARITSSYAYGSVSGNDEIGGLVGDGDEVTITSSYAAASASGSVGIGGMIGYGRKARITSSYAYGSVNSTRRAPVGGLVGVLVSFTFKTNVYWDNQTTGAIRTEGQVISLLEGKSEGRSTADLQDPAMAAVAVYVNWEAETCPDGSRAWDFGTAMQYPALTCPPKGLDAQRP